MKNDKAHWKAEAQKFGGDALVEKIVEIIKTQNEFRDILRSYDDRHDQHEAGFAMLLKAFPGGDTEGHRRAHEAMIERTAELRRLRIAIQQKTLEGLVWAIIVGAGIVFWNWFLHLIGRT